MRAEILVGDCRQRLAELPSDSVQCVVTSPPYWGLRAYSTNPQVWGGDPECDHDWATERYYREGGASAGSHESFTGAGPGNAARLKETRWRENTTCNKCGAWRGECGQEPTVEMHVRNLVEVFREVRRVLRPDGTLWLNYGDCYACYPNGRSAVDSKAAGANDDRTHRDKPFSTVTAGFKETQGGAVLPGVDRFRDINLKPKDLVGMPWRVAFALQDDGWWLRRDIIWDKPNAKPESAKDRPTTAHEYVFLFAKSPRYYYDADAIREPHTEESLARIGRGRSDDHKWADGGPGGETIANDLSQACHPNGRNKRSVWRVNTAAYKGAHYATFPPDLIKPMILAGTSERGCCPTCGAPWERITVKGEPDRDWQQRCGADRSGGYQGQATKDYAQAKAEDPSALKARILEGMRTRRTVGWKKTCQCPRHEPVPCVVLDPFGGSGTVGQVATDLWRRAILVELNPSYAEQAQRRNQQHGLEF